MKKTLLLFCIMLGCMNSIYASDPIWEKQFSIDAESTCVETGEKTSSMEEYVTIKYYEDYIVVGKVRCNLTKKTDNGKRIYKDSMEFNGIKSWYIFHPGGYWTYESNVSGFGGPKRWIRKMYEQ